jgi:pimeloyl-ACP methyl ester carboxylesterase
MVLFAVPVFSAPERASFGAQPPIPFDEEGDWAREEWRRSWRWRGPGQSRESVLRTFAEKMRPGARERGARAIAAFDMAGALRASTTPLLLVRPKDDLWEATGRAFDLRPDVGHVELPDLGHGVWEVATRRVDEIVRQFLDR